MKGGHEVKKGTVEKFVSDNRVIVQGLNLAKKHQKPNPSMGVPGGIEEKERPLDLSNIGMFNPETKKADRIGFKTLEDGRKVRYFKSNKEVVDI